MGHPCFGMEAGKQTVEYEVQINAGVIELYGSFGGTEWIGNGIGRKLRINLSVVWCEKIG